MNGKITKNQRLSDLLRHTMFVIFTGPDPEAMRKEWFTHWFDSPYYHLLYQHHNDDEARLLIDNLFKRLSPAPYATILDLACGRGRHALYMSRAGYDVTGLDISTSSIAYARQFEQEHLTFYQHDMRHLFRTNYFDYVFNFFTSFGYFKTEKEHLQTLRNIQIALKPGGYFVLDFLNSAKVIARLVPEASVDQGAVHFQIKRFVRDGYIFKQIDVRDGDQTLAFEEQVRAFQLTDFQHMFDQVGLELESVFGSHQLEAFEPNQSDRLILFVRKPSSST